MTTQAITDYLTKQLFIEKNIVTYRSLSRHFSLHVNVAKNELATFHHNAPFQSQTCRATFLLSGIPKPPPPRAYNEDYDMEGTSDDSQEEDDGEEVPQVQITIVNEGDLEAAKAIYSEITSIHLYSVSPAPLHDAGLICPPTESVRCIDKEKGPAFSVQLGRIVANGVKMGPSKRKVRPGAPVAGPSKLKMPEPKGAAAKAETKNSTTTMTTDKGKEKEKPKQTGKLQFVSKAKEPMAVEKPVKQEETEDSKKKKFFSKPVAPAKVVPEKSIPKAKEVEVAPKEEKQEEEPVKEVTKLKFGPPRGVKRKSSVGLEPKKEQPAETIATTSKAPAAPAPETHRGKRRVVLSDDEDEDVVMVKPPPRRKARPSHTTESTENSDAEREARALMDIDDDQVEKVSRVPSTNASSNELDDEDDLDASPGVQDEDVSMEEDAPVKEKPKPKAKKPKAVVPVGSNGLKKRKVTKTRRTKNANGYMVKEDYSDWESVEEGDEPEEAAPLKPAPKPKAVQVKKVKKEEEESADVDDTAPAKAKAPKKEPAPAKKAPAKPAAKPKAAAKGTSIKGKGQQTLNFFGPKKT